VNPSARVSADFVFGTLATDDLRIEQLRAMARGVVHDHMIEPADPEPGDDVTVRVTVGPDVDVDRVTCYWTADGSAPAGAVGRATNGRALELRREGVRWDTLAWSYVESWSGAIPAQPDGTLIRYRLEAWSIDGRVRRWAEDPVDTSAPDASPPERRSAFAFRVDRDRPPDWLRDAVIYQVFVDRFATTGGAPFASPGTPAGLFGGTLRGVIEQLDHVEAVGATCLWLSPVFPSPSHHGYDTTDHGAVEPRLGTRDDVRALVEAAHARGIRVILDFVANHVSAHHPAFRRAQADPASPEASWFLFRRWPDRYDTFFGVPDHPRLNTDDAGARGHLVASARAWLELGVDGFRCDYANGPSHAFWSLFHAATRDARPDSVTIGEVVETPELQRTYRGRLDGCLDFLLMQALRGFFAFGDLSASGFDAFLRRHLAYVADDLVMPSFLDNHDMNRFLWVVGGDRSRLRLAALCQFTLPGPPIVYYGTEVGLGQDRDVRSPDGSGHPEESRLPMPARTEWDTGLLAFYGALARLRRSDPGLWRGTRTTLVVDDVARLLVTAVQEGGRRAVIAINGGDTAVEVALPGTGFRTAVATDDKARLAADRLHLGPWSGAVLLSSREGETGPGRE
jgi:cyclomaltodextrinase